MLRLRLLAFFLGVMMHFPTFASEHENNQPPIPETAERAVFAGGCFWCIEAELQELDGIYAVISGYTGGTQEDAVYDKVASGNTDHVEAVEVYFEQDSIPYPKLLDYFWGNIDPTDDGGQFYDRGNQYRTAIFYINEQQRVEAEASKQAVEQKLGQEVATRILPAEPFYPAEDYHQDYYRKSPLRYNAYKHGSRRESTLDRIWGEHRNELKSK